MTWPRGHLRLDACPQGGTIGERRVVVVSGGAAFGLGRAQEVFTRTGTGARRQMSFLTVAVTEIGSFGVRLGVMAREKGALARVRGRGAGKKARQPS